MSRDEKLGWVLAGVVIAFVLGSAVRELTDYKEAGIGAAIGLPSIIALFGMLWIAPEWKDALTASLVVAYLILIAGIVSMGLFAGRPLPFEGATKAIIDGFTGLVGVVVSFYITGKAVEKLADTYQAVKVAEISNRKK